MVPFKYSMLGLLLVLCCTQANAAEDEQPSDELLEFLGSFESAKGEWIDPNGFELPLPDPHQAEKEVKKEE